MTKTWQADIITLFPEMFPGPLGCSLAGTALKKGLWSCKAHDLREHGIGIHRNVDDQPFGGGSGMVIRPDVLDQALSCVKKKEDNRPAIYFTPRGRRLDQAMAGKLSKGNGVILLCGRFEGVDERFLEKNEIIEVSLGDFVLSGGEIPALALLDSCIRLLPGVMGSKESLEEESFSNGLLEYPQYTRPANWDGLEVPEILLSGHHAAIKAWRAEKALEATKQRRPDLLEKSGVLEEK
ncbi:tRNA (guanosine(37)-N1)-methyltransferase TrmD [Acetobacteraceae bacterium]|nr:tRNA (guanosine(37)-N1)-methyltransferase TrmD [Acetobacteraceae bacterium]